MDIKTQKNLTRASKLAKRGELKEAEKIIKEKLNCESSCSLTGRDEKQDNSTNTNGLINKINDEISVVNGKYGPYFRYKGKNYSVYKKYNAKELTLEDAMKIVEYKNKK